MLLPRCVTCCLFPYLLDEQTLCGSSKYNLSMFFLYESFMSFAHFFLFCSLPEGKVLLDFMFFPWDFIVFSSHLSRRPTLNGCCVCTAGEGSNLSAIKKKKKNYNQIFQINCPRDFLFSAELQKSLYCRDMGLFLDSILFLAMSSRSVSNDFKTGMD